MSTPEKILEQNLIAQLTTGVSQWTYRPDIKTEDQLWDNFREKLNRNNVAVLNGVRITDSEMEQIKNRLLQESVTSYKAACWLTGEHRIVQVPLVREDASLGTIYLQVLNNREIAGGNSSYEVINQFAPGGADRDRRFDVTLLINGLPLIHIELKNPDHPFMDAFRQIKKYCREGQFKGLFGFVQMFVVSNGVETRYIAANKNGEMNEKFLSRWVDEKNEPVDDYLGFAKDVLNIPAAHLMVGNYSVIDQEKRKLILLRPYQIHAIDKIKEASRKQESGFVWHTTGSGKTLTSYTVTKNLLDIPAIDKTIFLIDRKDLDQQTSNDFQSYAENDDVDIEDTARTSVLEDKLLNDSRIAIVTTIQKFQNILRKYSKDQLTPQAEKARQKLKNKHLAFVIDECHRTVTPETKREIERFFDKPGKKSLWYGFTGTPIFDKNKKAAKGDLPRTTEQQFGPLLHTYTIKEAIKDGAVLGFQIQSLGHSEEQIRQLALDNKLFTEEELTNKPQDEIETAVINHYERNGEFYGTDEHKNQVIDYIINKSEGKFGLNAGEGNTYEAILTCSSIAEAQRYYQLIKAFKDSGKIDKRILQKLPDFPKVAITYTVGENDESAEVNQKHMQQSLEDYNRMFKKNYGLEDIAAYNADLNKRLARKLPTYSAREEQLDLVIVVDRLLTGFDAPCLSTIFLDRAPMKPQHLIQAFSRTNRLFDKTKRYGQICTMQYPANYAKKIDEALVLYSLGSSGDVSAPDWKTTKGKLKAAVKQLRNIAQTSKDVLALSDEKELADFISAFQAVDRYLASARVYDEFQENEIQKQFGINSEEFEQYCGVYQNALEKLREIQKGKNNPDPVSLVEFDYELESIRTTEVNYKYLITLIQSHIPVSGDTETREISEEEDKKICAYINEYKKSNPHIGQIVEQVWFEVRMNPMKFEDLDAWTIIQERVQQIISKEISEFSRKWFVSEQEVGAEAMSWKAGDQVHLTGDYEEYKSSGNPLSKLRYMSELRKAAESFFKDTVVPFRKF